VDVSELSPVRLFMFDHEFTSADVDHELFCDDGELGITLKSAKTNASQTGVIAFSTAIITMDNILRILFAFPIK
jgi:hypothetical protein